MRLDVREHFVLKRQISTLKSMQMFSKHHTWTVNRTNTSQELYTIQQDDAGSVAGANVYLPGKPRYGVSTADYIVRVQDHGKDFQVVTKAGQLLAEV